MLKYIIIAQGYPYENSRSRGTEIDMANVMSKIKGFFGKIGDFFAGVWNKCADFFKEKTKNVKWKIVWDKFTTGLLILLIASPVLILAYIFLWFILRSAF